MSMWSEGIADLGRTSDEAGRARLPGVTHWLTRYDPDDGEPYGTLCYCDIGSDHDGDGNITGPDHAR